MTPWFVELSGHCPDILRWDPCAVKRLQPKHAGLAHGLDPDNLDALVFGVSPYECTGSNDEMRYRRSLQSFREVVEMADIVQYQRLQRAEASSQQLASHVFVSTG